GRSAGGGDDSIRPGSHSSGGNLRPFVHQGGSRARATRRKNPFGRSSERRRIKAMSQTTQKMNKALVLEAFDTLFNHRDYAAAERFWSPDYIQHSAHI